jgi:hypothetical protein
MSVVKLVAIFSENKLGQLERVTHLLASTGINIQWVAIATTESFGVIKLLVNQCDTAYQLLKAHGFTTSLLEVLAVEVQDKPGGLHFVAEAFTRHQVNVQNASGFVSNNRAVLLIEVKDIAQARAVAGKEGLRLLTQEEAVRL